MPLKTRGRSDRLGSSDMIAIQIPCGVHKGRMHDNEKPDKALIQLYREGNGENRL
jgi:hypothetical protein